MDPFLNCGLVTGPGLLFVTLTWAGKSPAGANWVGVTCLFLDVTDTPGTAVGQKLQPRPCARLYVFVMTCAMISGLVRKQVAHVE